MALRKEKINGIQMCWQEEGSGDPFLLIHGFPFNHETWEPQIQYFAGMGWRVIAPDLRGYGQSEGTPDQTSTPELLAEDMVALLDFLKIEKAVIMGLSMGGYICFALYRYHPEKVRALILADTKSEPDSEEAQQNRYKLREAVQQQGSSAAANANVPKLFAPESYRAKQDLVGRVSGIIERTDPATIAATLPGLAERSDSTPLLSQIKVPVLVIHGKEDQLMPVDKAREMARAIPDWQFSSVPHAGHMSNLENPEFFNQAVESFLKELK